MANKYAKIMGLEFSTLITYKGEVFIGIILNSLYLFVNVFFWKSIFTNNPNSIILGFTQESIITYAILVQFLVSTLMGDSFLWKISQIISKGEMVNYITKPINFFNYMFFSNLGQALYKLIFKGIPFIIIFTMFNLFTYPALQVIPYFIISIIFGMIIQFTLIFIISLLSAWFENPFASNGLYFIFTYGLGGRLIPLDFFPATIKTFINYLPFQHILYTPAIIFSKQLTTQATPLIINQIIWIVILTILSKIVFKKALKTQTILGG